MKHNKPSLKKTNDEGGISGEGQSGPAGNNEPHGKSRHSDPSMTPGVSQAGTQARKEEDQQPDPSEEEAAQEQLRKEASTERD